VRNAAARRRIWQSSSRRLLLDEGVAVLDEPAAALLAGHVAELRHSWKQCSRSSPGAESIKIDVGSSAWSGARWWWRGAVVEWFQAGGQSPFITANDQETTGIARSYRGSR
jgi:hypothetical protein